MIFTTISSVISMVISGFILGHAFISPGFTQVILFSCFLSMLHGALSAAVAQKFSVIDIVAICWAVVLLSGYAAYDLFTDSSSAYHYWI